MSEFVIYHNPRCGKSRAALAILRQHKIEPKIVEYLKTPLDKAQLKRLIKQLGISVRDLIREGEDGYREQQLGDPTRKEDELIDAIVDNPILLQRPIIVRGDRAVIGRPPETVKNLFDS